MKLQHLQILYTISIVMIGVSLVMAILSETGIYAIADFDVMQLVYLSAVLWFLVWQLRRNAMRQ